MPDHSFFHSLFVTSLYCLVTAQAACTSRRTETVQTNVASLNTFFCIDYTGMPPSLLLLQKRCSRSSKRVLYFDGVTSVALAVSTTGTLVAARAFPVLAVATALSLASLAAGAGAVGATLAIIATVTL